MVRSLLLCLVAACAGRALEPAAANAPVVVGSAASVGSTTPKTAASPNEAWVHDPHPDLRRITVVVRASPPAELAAKYRQLAARYQRIEPLLLAAAEGGFGSGFAVVRRVAADGGATASRAFVVTNHHVVDLATDATVVFNDTELEVPARVIDIDPLYDLAILGPASDPPPRGWPSSGLDVATAPAQDQEVVVASGYPGLGNKPSYQITRGIVSNQRFVLDDGTGERLYFQHTAPIDPGSSGGPLTTEDGKLLGVNTLKAKHREAVGIAVPASAVVAAVERVLSAPRRDDADGADVARSACQALVQALSRGQVGLGAAERAIGSKLAADEGMNSLGYLPNDPEWLEAFVTDPTRVLVRATALRLLATVAPEDATAETCVPAGGGATTAAFAFKVKTRRGATTWTFAREQGAFKLVGGQLASAKERLSGAAPHQGKKWTPTLR